MTGERRRRQGRGEGKWAEETEDRRRGRDGEGIGGQGEVAFGEVKGLSVCSALSVGREVSLPAGTQKPRTKPASGGQGVHGAGLGCWAGHRYTDALGKGWTPC